MAEGARLESVYTATYRGFESPPHRHILRRARTQVRAFFSHVAPTGGMRTPDRGSTTGAANWTDREPASGLPRRGERSESIPPSPPYFKKSSYASTGFFFACGTHRGSTTGAASWTDREPASGLPRRGERSESIPPHRHILRRARTQVRAFFRMWHRRHPRGRHQCLSRATRPYPPGSPLCAAPPEGPPKTTKPGLARALLTV